MENGVYIFSVKQNLLENSTQLGWLAADRRGKWKTICGGGGRKLFKNFFLFLALLLPR